MTLSTLWGKLRKRNKRDYRQFQFVILFAEMLISSYLMMMYSPLVSKSLPDGGDTLKIASLVFGIAAVGCLVFVWYAARLFLRYKSREIGVFMALGAEKGILSKALFIEMTKITGTYALEGLAAGAVLSAVIGKVMEWITAEVNEYPFAFTMTGLAASVLFGLVLIGMILLLSYRAMGRTNIMDVINEQRKQEPLKKSVTKGYLITAVICIAVGLFVSVILPSAYIKLTNHYLGAWSNLFYFVAVFGLYRILVYSVSSHQRGRNPQKYYNNLLNYGMMKFQGASVVRNMLVMVLLIVAALYSAMYVPLMTGGTMVGEDDYEAKYSYRYLKDGDMPDEEEVRKLASEYAVEITDYREAEFIRVIGSAVNRDTNEDGTEVIEELIKDFAQYDVLSASAYEALTGNRLKINQGEYYLIQNVGATENFWYKADDMKELYAESEQVYLPMEYQGNAEYSALLARTDGMGTNSRFVVNDADYERLKAGLPAQNTGTQVLFDSVKSDGEIPFSMELFKRLVNGMSEEMNHMSNYNPMEEIRLGDAYADMADPAMIDPENPVKEQDWWYAPLLVPIVNQQTILGLAIRMLLFIYVAAICVAAVGIIGYSRSQSVGIGSRQIFEDIKRLGADANYRRWLMKKQLQKVYVLPTALGVLVILAYMMMILYSNDGVIKSYEIGIFFMAVALGIVMAVFQYGMYRKSVKSVERILKLRES